MYLYYLLESHQTFQSISFYDELATGMAHFDWSAYTFIGCCVDFKRLYALEVMLERIVSVSTLNLIQCPELEYPQD